MSTGPMRTASHPMHLQSPLWTEAAAEPVEPGPSPPDRAGATPPHADPCPPESPGGDRDADPATRLRDALDALCRPVPEAATPAAAAAVLDQITVLAQIVRRGPVIPHHPAAAELVRAGVSPAVAAALAARAQARRATVPDHAALVAEIARTLRVAPPLWARSGRAAAALVGPAGCGKTTALLQIAAEAAVVHRRRVVVVDAASPSAGHAAMLRAYAEVVGARCAHASAAEVAQAVSTHADADLVLVDTPGTDPWDEAAVGRLDAALAAAGVERHLVLPASWRADLVVALVRRHEAAGLTALTVTQTDHCRRLGHLVDALWQCPHPVAHWTTAPLLPGGIEAADAERIARRILPAPAWPPPTAQGQ